VRPSTIICIVAALVVGIGAAIGGIFVFFNNNGGEFWFYWIAPLLVIGFLLSMVQLTVMYWIKVGRLETKGRPKT
jgi:hypothetical protein